MARVVGRCGLRGRRRGRDGDGMGMEWKEDVERGGEKGKESEIQLGMGRGSAHVGE